jgi:hypothetical protein
VKASAGTHVEPLVRPLRPEAMRTGESLAAPVPAPLRADPLGADLLRADPLSAPVWRRSEPAEPARDQRAEEVQSLAFWRRPEPQGPAAGLTGPTPAAPRPAAEANPAQTTLGPPGGRLRDHRPAGPARSIIGMVPPAVTGDAPAAPELRQLAADPGHADTVLPPPDPEFP